MEVFIAKLIGWSPILIERFLRAAFPEWFW